MDQPGPLGSSNHDDRPGQRPTQPLGGPAQSPEPPPASGQPGSDLRSPAPTAPLPGDPSATPTFAAAGPPGEALAGFWRRAVAAFLDWLLVGIVAAAIGDLFGVDAPSPPSADGGVNIQLAGTGPFICPGVRPCTHEQPLGPAVLPLVLVDAVGTPQADLAQIRRPADELLEEGDVSWAISS